MVWATRIYIQSTMFSKLGQGVNTWYCLASPFLLPSLHLALIKNPEPSGKFLGTKIAMKAVVYNSKKLWTSFIPGMHDMSSILTTYNAIKPFLPELGPNSYIKHLMYQSGRKCKGRLVVHTKMKMPLPLRFRTE